MSAGFNQLFQDNNSINGVVCFLLAGACYLVFGLSQNIWLTIVVIGAATTFILAVLGIRRILSMTLGGYSLSGLVTGVLGAGM